MTFRTTLVVVLALQFGVIPAFAQRDGGFQRWPTREREASPAAPAATPQREQGARPRPSGRQSRTESAPRPPAATQPVPQRERRSQSIERDAERRDGPARQPRVAVPRQGPPPRTTQRPSRQGSNFYIARPPSYRYVPRFNRPYVFGSLGSGYFYYGSFGWYPRATYYYDGGYFGRGYGYDTGEVRLRVEPRWAEVYVDGYFAGTVDDFDGTFQSLKLESGPYHVEIVAPGYEPLEVDLLVTPGRKITYRGDLRRAF